MWQKNKYLQAGFYFFPTFMSSSWILQRHFYTCRPKMADFVMAFPCNLMAFSSVLVFCCQTKQIPCFISKAIWLTRSRRICFTSFSDCVFILTLDQIKLSDVNQQCLVAERWVPVNAVSLADCRSVWVCDRQRLRQDVRSSSPPPEISHHLWFTLSSTHCCPSLSEYLSPNRQSS